jgi:tRNA-dihydrouridine synthase 3
LDRQEAGDFFRGVVAMAPMATGGNLPYRRLCRDFGAVRTCSEMVLAHKLVKGGDRPLLRHHETETDFGVQLAGKRPELMTQAALIALEHGANFIDLNFGCPIDIVVRYGSGAAMLKKPNHLAAIVAEVRRAIEVPLSVKIRLGYTEDKINCVKIAKLVEEAGADAVTVHGRTRAQRYRNSARWEMIDEVAQAVNIPVIGNGDILTPWDLRRRRAETAVSSFLVARGALIKPWIFKELAEDTPWEPTVAERWAILRKFVDYSCEHFGEDEKGLGRVRRFFLWHCDFWYRHRPWTEDDFQQQHPDSLIQARFDDVTGEPDLVLFASSEPADHEVIWNRVLDRDYPTE